MPVHAVGFGKSASRWAARVRTPIPMLVCEPATASYALARAYEMRMSGDDFYASVILNDRRAWWLHHESALALERFSTHDQERRLFEALKDESVEIEGTTLSSVYDVTANQTEALRAFIALASGIAVRSAAEAERLRSLLGPISRPLFVVIASDREVPLPVDGPRATVVLWSPRHPAPECRIFLNVLHELDCPWTVVGNDDGAALSRASVIIDTSIDDPATAIALAAWNRPLLVDSSTGAREFIRDVYPFSTHNRASINNALLSAFGGRAPHLRPMPAPEFPIPFAPLERIAERPLVSVCVPTYNRPRQLREALETIDQQTYPNLEIVVVNDAGSSVEEVVRAFPRARAINHTNNRGPAATLNTAMHAARGEWFAFLDDDDLWFNDHLSRMVAAALRSGKRVVCGQAIFRSILRESNGEVTVVGLHMPFSSTYDRSQLRAMCTVVSPARMMHRSIIEEVGYYDESLIRLHDYEHIYRLGRATSFARVDEVTSVYTMSLDSSNRTAQRVEELPLGLEQIYARNTVDDSYIEWLREEMLLSLRSGKTWPL